MLSVKIINRSSHPLPAYATAGAAGMDLRAHIAATVRLAPMERQLLPTGIFIALPAGYEAQIRPRSSLALSKGLSIPNAPGTIDADYRGEIKILLINLSNAVVEIANGDRIAQMVVAPCEHVQWEEVTMLPITKRASGGFGSTGWS